MNIQAIQSQPRSYISGSVSKAVKIHVFDCRKHGFSRLSTLRLRLTPSLQWTPSNIGTNLILPETSVIGLHLCRWQYGSILIQIFTVSSERRTCFETECIMTVQGHPKSLILAPIESAYMTTHSTSSNLGPILPRSEILELLYAESHFFQHPTPIRAKISGFSPWSRPVMFGLQRANIPG